MKGNQRELHPYQPHAVAAGVCMVSGRAAGRVTQAGTGGIGRNWEEVGSLGKDIVILLWLF